MTFKFGEGNILYIHTYIIIVELFSSQPFNKEGIISKLKTKTPPTYIFSVQIATLVRQ